MRFVCESCRAQYMINDEKVGPKGVKVRCRKCGYVILVKRPDAAKGGNGPVVMSNDPDDAMATQVMQTPLGGPGTTLSNDATNPGEADLPSEERTQTSGPSLEQVEDKGARAAVKDSFLGADDDEIGAVFDQVLRTGPTALPKEGLPEKSDDDRQSTRVIDADMVKKLAEQSSGRSDDVETVEKKVEAVPETDWYVAIDEKQTGPLTLEKVKEHWDKGEIGPDSLCWRAGFDDWIPVSEAKMLASVLAPQPPKPIVVAPAPMAAASVVSVPVQSAFSAGGVMQTVQSEVQVPLGLAAASADGEDTSTWRPTAASALASLVNAELDALSKPAPKAPPPPVADEVPMTRGLLDLPMAEEKPAAAPEQVRPAPAHAPLPVNPYLANPGATFSAPAVTQYRPPSNRNLILAISAGGGLILLILIGLVIWLATRTPQVVVAPTPQPPSQPIAVAQPPSQPVAVAQPPAQPAQPTQPPPTAVAQPPAQPTQPPPTAVAQPPAPPTQPPPAQPNPPAEVAKKDPTPKSPRTTPPRTAKSDPPEPKPAKEPKESPKPSGGGDDDFAAAFGVPKDPEPKRTAKTEPGSSKKDVYIPPAPGATNVKESLGSSDIMEVVLANKAALTKCAETQRQKDPGTSGKLVMRWTIQTSGRTSNVGVVSEEFKGTYMASCVGGLIKSWQFPKHKQQGEPVTFPFKF
ncbi:MAG: adventurous gliding motility protein GltJ [Myxococcota bacterium]